MRVAVLISTYNGEKYIEEQINSILSQETQHNIDIFVRDDGSTDGTVFLLKRIQEQTGIHVTVDGENIKPAKSFIKMLRNIEGYDFYAFSDQDDSWHKDKVERAVSRLQGNHLPALYHSNSRLVDSAGRPIGINLYTHNDPPCDFHSIFCACNVQGCTLVINSALAALIRNHTLPQRIVMHDAYIAKVCAAVGGVIIYDQKPSMDYRQHSENVIGAQVGAFAKIKKSTAEIFQRSSLSIADQARDILIEYDQIIPVENKEWISKVANYNKNAVSRASLAFSRKLKFTSRNREIATRMGILFGNK